MLPTKFNSQFVPNNSAHLDHEVSIKCGDSNILDSSAISYQNPWYNNGNEYICKNSSSVMEEAIFNVPSSIPVTSMEGSRLPSYHLQSMVPSGSKKYGQKQSSNGNRSH